MAEFAGCRKPAVKNVVIRRFIRKEEEGKYFLIPFMLPENVEKLTVTYRYDKAGNTIDIGLCGQEKIFIGWAGSDRNEIMVSEALSSNGFAALPLMTGKWYILVGAYHVAPEGVLVEYTLSMKMKERRLLKGDLHMHTNGSDGAMSLELLTQIAENMGLDYIFITDHNNYAQNDHLRSTEQLTVMPGAEWTHYKGHANFLGVRKPFTQFIANTREEMISVFEEAHANGALTVINHPFCPYCGWRWGLEGVPYDLIELFNGGIVPAANVKCLQWWDTQLQAGRKIPVIGGSDFHRFERGQMPAQPCTNLYAISKAPSDILEAVRNGHSVITFGKNGPYLSLQREGTWEKASEKMNSPINGQNPDIRMPNDEILPGDTVPSETKLKLTLTGLWGGDEIRLIRNGQVRAEITDGSSWQGEYDLGDSSRIGETERTSGRRGYFRVEVRRKVPSTAIAIPVLVSNPVYTE